MKIPMMKYTLPNKVIISILFGTGSLGQSGTSYICALSFHGASAQLKLQNVLYW